MSVIKLSPKLARKEVYFELFEHVKGITIIVVPTQVDKAAASRTEQNNRMPLLQLHCWVDLLIADYSIRWECSTEHGQI